MTKIAIAGEPKDRSAIGKALSELFKMADVSVFSYKDTKYATFKQLAHDGAHVFIAPIGIYLLEKTKTNIDILIFANNSSVPADGVLNLINEDAIIILSADDKEVYRYLIGSRATLLTYGFNQKASVTASSIEENMEKKFIQFCIQRSFRTITGSLIEAQEIPVTLNLSTETSVLNEIAAITCSLALGVNVRTISLAY